MRRLWFSLIVLALPLVLALPARAFADAYLAEIDDLPLAPGLTEQPGATLFDTPGGRVVDAVATGAAAPGAVSDFYAQSLPDLGWQSEPGDAYVRDGEELHIQIGSAGGGSVSVHFSLAPLAQSGAAPSSSGVSHP